MVRQRPVRSSVQRHCHPPLEGTMSTRAIAIAALVIAVVLLVIFVF